MTVHMMRDVERLKKKLLALGARVEDAFQRGVRSVTERDAAAAAEVLASDRRIDELEVEVEEDCLKILALHQPVAIDLRFLVAILKINSDLERIGDLAVNIAQQGRHLALREPLEIPFDFPGMAARTRSMLERSLNALVNMDAALAREVCRDDDEVDRINREMFAKVEGAIRRRPERMEDLIRLFAISRHVERVADHATNVAEDVLYMTMGEIVRHRMHELAPGEGAP